jgi:hypothetical protein
MWIVSSIIVAFCYTHWTFFCVDIQRFLLPFDLTGQALLVVEILLLLRLPLSNSTHRTVLPLLLALCLLLLLFASYF